MSGSSSQSAVDAAVNTGLVGLLKFQTIPTVTKYRGSTFCHTILLLLHLTFFIILIGLYLLFMVANVNKITACAPR